MKDLPVSDLPGLVRARPLPLLHEIAMPLPRPAKNARLLVRHLDDGSLLLRWKGRREVVHWSADGRFDRFDLGADTADSWGLDARANVIAIASPGSLALFDRKGRVIQRVQFDEPATGASCRITADGSVFCLSTLRDGTACLRLLDSNGRSLDEKSVTHDSKRGPVHWLEDAHPSLPLCIVSAGMGQDGAFFMLAHAESGKLGLDAPVDATCFASWCADTDADLFTLPHHGNVLRACRLDASVVWERDLGPILEALDDGHSWTAQALSGGRVLIPTSEGRLLAVPRAGEAIELRPAGDERNWDWSYVRADAGRRLFTTRSGDAVVRVWDLSA